MEASLWGANNLKKGFACKYHLLHVLYPLNVGFKHCFLLILIIHMHPFALLLLFSSLQGENRLLILGQCANVAKEEAGL